MVAACTAPQLLVGWYNGRGPRLFFIGGFVGLMTAFMIMGARRRWQKAYRADYVPSRWRFSAAELLLMFTGAIFYLGFTAADYRQSQLIHREREQFQALAAPALGPEGRLGFDSDGALHITICDRSFDDKRLRSLAALIRERKADADVRRLWFGSGAKTARTPPRWPGVTDQSVEVFLRWNQLEWLFIEGTAITAAKREQLLMLPELNELSRESLRE
jgi:hypothetical protein